MKRLNSKRVKADIILIGIILLLALILYLLLNAFSGTGEQVVVRINGEKVCEYSLNDDGTYPLNGGTNILVISGGKAYITEANCPDKICINQGKISKTGQCITCLPNRVTVTVEGGKSEVDITVG